MDFNKKRSRICLPCSTAKGVYRKPKQKGTQNLSLVPEVIRLVGPRVSADIARVLSQAYLLFFSWYLGYFATPTCETADTPRVLRRPLVALRHFQGPRPRPPNSSPRNAVGVATKFLMKNQMSQIGEKEIVLLTFLWHSTEVAIGVPPQVRRLLNADTGIQERNWAKRKKVREQMAYCRKAASRKATFVSLRKSKQLATQ